MTDAEKCKARGWPVGTQLVGDDGYGPTVIVITAIGEANILARQISHKGKSIPTTENMWTLQYRDWKAVE